MSTTNNTTYRRQQNYINIFASRYTRITLILRLYFVPSCSGHNLPAISVLWNKLSREDLGYRALIPSPEIGWISVDVSLPAVVWTGARYGR